jgi:hypothetical protein
MRRLEIKALFNTSVHFFVRNIFYGSDSKSKRIENVIKIPKRMH